MENLLPDFYVKKSVLRKWLYSVMFYDTRIANVIKPHHVVDISLPFYAFEANATSYGSITKSFSTLQKDHGLAFSITLEDDRFGNVTKLIHVFQRTIVNQNGVYNTLSSQLLDKIRVTISDDSGKDIMAFVFVNCRFVGADDFSLSYSDSETLKHKINFICDVCNYEYLLTEEESNPSEVPRPANSYGYQASTSIQDAINAVKNTPQATPTYQYQASTSVQDAVNGTGGSAKANVSKISSTAAMGAASMATAIPGVSKAVSNVGSNALSKLGTAQTAAQSAVGGVVSSVTSKVTPTINNAQSSIMSGVSRAQSQGAGAISSVSSRVASTLGSGAGNAVKSNATNAASKGISVLKSGFSKLKLF